MDDLYAAVEDLDASVGSLQERMSIAEQNIANLRAMAEDVQYQIFA